MHVGEVTMQASHAGEGPSKQALRGKRLAVGAGGFALVGPGYCGASLAGLFGPCWPTSLVGCWPAKMG